MHIDKIIIMDKSEITSKARQALLDAGCTTYIEPSESVLCYIDQLADEAKEEKILAPVVKKAKAFAKAQGFSKSDQSDFKLLITL